MDKQWTKCIFTQQKPRKHRVYEVLNGDCIYRMVRQTGLEVRQCNFMNCRHFQKLPILRHFAYYNFSYHQ